jgi:uncharacterized protein YbjT (DUF2867 family)
VIHAHQAGPETAVVLTTEGHVGAVDVLGGDEAFTLAELAAAIAAAAGKQTRCPDKGPRPGRVLR